MVMDLIRVDYCWGRPNGLVILLDQRLLWQITCLDLPFFITPHALKGRRFSGLLSDLLIVFLV